MPTTLFFLASFCFCRKTLTELEEIAKPLTCYYHLYNCMMKLEVNDPTIQYTIHSPYDVITDESVFTEIGPTEELQNTYTVSETT